MTRLLVKKTAQGGEAIGFLDVRQVAAVRDEFEGALPEAVAHLSRLGGGEHPVGRAPNNERRDLEARKLVNSTSRYPQTST